MQNRLSARVSAAQADIAAHGDRVNREVFSCWCVPSTICGKKSDRLFAYHTPRTVTILDRSLGIVKNLLMLVIFLYVFIFNMWYKGVHFELSEVEGLVRQEWMEPTRNLCKPNKLDCASNFTPVSELPYCTGYRGEEASPVVRECEYFDARELPITLSAGILLPTYIVTYTQARQCEPNSDSCQKKYAFIDENNMTQYGTGYGEPDSRIFVANAEDFTVTLDHSFRTTDGKVSYDDFLMQGRWRVCEKDANRNETDDFLLDAANEAIPKDRDCTTKPMECGHNHCDEMAYNSEAVPFISQILTGAGTWKSAAASFLGSGARQQASGEDPSGRGQFQRLSQGSAAQDQGSNRADDSELLGAQGPAAEMRAARAKEVVSVKTGDVLSLGTLLTMAGEEALDQWWVDEDDGIQTLRSRGTAVVVHIQYDNVEPWTLLRPRDPPFYTISVTSRPTPEFKHSFTSPDELSDDKRRLYWVYGIYVIVEQSGKIRTFSLVNTLMTMTSALLLMAIANTLTDFLALYIMPKRHTYRRLKFSESDKILSPEESVLASARTTARETAEAPRAEEMRD